MLFVRCHTKNGDFSQTAYKILQSREFNSVGPSCTSTASCEIPSKNEPSIFPQYSLCETLRDLRFWCSHTNGIAPLRVFTTRISIDGFWLVVRITSRKIKAKLFEAILASTQPQRLYLTSNLKSTTQITYVSTAKLDENKGPPFQCANCCSR